jgi:hypothetical protein
MGVPAQIFLHTIPLLCPRCHLGCKPTSGRCSFVACSSASMTQRANIAWSRRRNSTPRSSTVTSALSGVSGISGSSDIPESPRDRLGDLCLGLFGVDPEAVRGITRRKRTLPVFQGFYSCGLPISEPFSPQSKLETATPAQGSDTAHSWRSHYASPYWMKELGEVAQEDRHDSSEDGEGHFESTRSQHLKGPIEGFQNLSATFSIQGPWGPPCRPDLKVPSATGRWGVLSLDG